MSNFGFNILETFLNVNTILNLKYFREMFFQPSWKPSRNFDNLLFLLFLNFLMLYLCFHVLKYV